MKYGIQMTTSKLSKTVWYSSRKIRNSIMNHLWNRSRDKNFICWREKSDSQIKWFDDNRGWIFFQKIQKF